jgi:3-phosphoshikimate 1-carboxyvinyltransferase
MSTASAASKLPVGVNCDPYPVPPFTRPCRGRVVLPGSKSLTNRALILAALHDGPTQLDGCLFSRDTRIAIDCLQTLGFEVRADEDRQRIAVEGQGGRIPVAHASLFVGNAGTAARFVVALVCLHPAGCYTFDGDPEMRRRPMAGLLDALTALGARFEFHGQLGHFPFTVHTAGIAGGVVAVDATASSQMLSALLMAGVAGRGPLEIQAAGVRPAFVEMTIGLLRQFGHQATADTVAGRYSVSPRPEAGRMARALCYVIEPDLTAASYFVALPYAVGGSLQLAHMPQNSLQGDVRFMEVMAHYGMRCVPGTDGWDIDYAAATARCGAQLPSGDAATAFDFSTFSDTFLTLAALSPLLPGPLRIDGIAHTRLQETDRVAAMACELSKCGVRVIEEQGALTLIPDRAAFAAAAQRGVTIGTWHDHRFAMSFAILGSVDVRGDGRPWLHIADPGCCAKTFPNYFAVLAEQHRMAHAEDL